MRRLFSMAGYLAIKEILHNKGRFLLVAMVIGLITLLVLFIAALGEGLGNGNREYISKLDAELIVYQAKSDFLIGASRLPRNRLDDISRVNGVADTGRLGTSNASIILADNPTPLKVALLGVDPGHAGEPQALQGNQLRSNTAKEAIIDRSTALRSGLKVGDNMVIRTTQGTDDKFYDLTVAGIAEGQQYSLQPSIFVPFNTWDKVRPKSEAELNMSNPIANVVLVKLADPNALEQVRQRITAEVNNVDVATINQAIQALPGYSAQQGWLHPVYRDPGDRRIFPDPGTAESTPDRCAQSHRHLQPGGCLGSHHPDHHHNLHRGVDRGPFLLFVLAYLSAYRAYRFQWHHLRGCAGSVNDHRSPGGIGLHPLCRSD